jgi:hypothetical protein
MLATSLRVSTRACSRAACVCPFDSAGTVYRLHTVSAESKAAAATEDIISL